MKTEKAAFEESGPEEDAWKFSWIFLHWLLLG